MRCLVVIVVISGWFWWSAGALTSPWLVKDENQDYARITPEDEMPNIVSQELEIKAHLGDTAFLPCDVIKLGKYSLVWQRGNKIIWVLKGDSMQNLHSQKAISDDRIEVVNTSLLIRNMTSDYSGVYSCEIHPANQWIQHKLVVQVPPTVKQSNRNFERAFEGNSVALSCNATGVPTPTIHWEKDDKIVQADNSGSLLIDSVQRTDEGIYSCIATNGVGDPAVAQMVLQVVYPPEVAAAFPTVYGGVGSNADLACIVRASPEAEVVWYKSEDPSTPLEFKEGMGKFHRHFLKIHPVHLVDFGDYVCHAANFYGNDSATVELTGRPKKPVITDVRRGHEPGQYVITWEVESYSSIANYELFFKEGTEDDGDESGWANVTVPGRQLNSIYHNQFYTIDDVTLNASLLVRIKANNEFGDSGWSDTSSFIANQKDEEQKIKLVTRATSKMELEAERLTSSETAGDDQADISTAPIYDSAENISISTSDQDDDDKNNQTSSSSGRPELTPAQKKAQMVAFITAIILSSFFY